MKKILSDFGLTKNKTKKKLALAYKKVFDLEDPQVVLVIKDLCSAHCVFGNDFDPDASMHAFNAGERNVILRILNIIALKDLDIIKLTDNEV